MSLNPLEGVGGGGALRPASAVLEEIATRASLSRRSSGQGQTAVGTPRATRSGGGARPPLSPAGGLPAASPTPAVAAVAVASAGQKAADDGVLHLPAL